MPNVVDFQKKVGKIKPMHAVNNGPVKAFYRYANDLNYGLPAEIEKRKLQYEYYRNKLLTFKEKL